MDNTPPRRANPFGVAALIAGILLLVASIANQALAPAIPTLLTESGMSLRFFPLLISLPPAIVAVIATVLGITGLLIRGRPRVAAIIGTTLGASHLVVGVAGMIGGMLVSALVS